MKTSGKSVLLIFLCTLFTSAGQLLWKAGVTFFNFSPPLSSHLLSFLNLPFLLGCISYGIGLLLMLLAFRSGELSVLYPIVATSYVWVSIASPFFFATERMNVWKWAGVLLIVVSVFFLTRNGKSLEQKEKNESALKAEPIVGGSV